MKTWSMIGVCLFVACGPKQVPDDKLAQVPSERVDELGARTDAIDATEDRLDDVRLRRDRAEKRLAEDEAALDDARSQLEEAKQSRIDAVKAGNQELASASESRVETLQATIADLAPEVDSGRDDVEELEAEVTVLEKRLAWQEADLEVARARAAVAGGATIDLTTYEDSAAKALEDYREAFAEWTERLEPDEAIRAEAFAPPASSGAD